MQIKRMAKKIAAIGIGAAMLGATVGGALAASTLADYPAPFLTDGVLDNTVIVVGKTADTSDVLGAIDIAAALQAEAVTPVASGVVETTVSEGVKVDKSGDKFNYGEDIYGVTPETLDDSDLPELLERGEYNDDEGANSQEENYDQTLAIASGVALFNMFTPEDGVAGQYLEVEDGDEVYTYTLEFDDAIEFSTSSPDDDLVGTQIDIMGNMYTITDVDTSSDIIDMITLVAGDSTVWLTQDQPLEWGGHTITIVDVGNDGTKCGVDVDGQLQWIADGSTSDDFPGGISIGVLEVIETAAEGGNACELSLGSAEIVLDEGSEITMNGAEIDGTEVSITGTAGEWTGFSLTYTADIDDDLYLAPGDAWTDPVFGSWKIYFSGVTADYEDMEFKSSGEDATFTFMNNDGVEVEIPFHYDGSSITLSYDDDEPLLLPGEVSTGLATDAADVSLLYTTSGGETHILKITDIDCTDSTKNTTTIEDVTYDRDVASNEEIVCDGAFHDVDLGSLGVISLNLTETYVGYASDGAKGAGTPESYFEGTFAFTDDNVLFTESTGDEAAASTLNLTLDWDDTDDEIYVTSFLDDDAAILSYEMEDGDDDVKMGVTAKGTLVEADTDENLWVKIQHPEEDAFANVFIMPLDASVSSSVGDGDAYSVNPFAVGLAVLDEDAEDLSKHMIVVGGPCANSVALELMGNTQDTCAEGFEEGKAMLKIFDRDGKTALLVAGYDAQDTVRASYVLAQHDGKYASKFADLGSEVELVVTDMEDVLFNTV